MGFVTSKFGKQGDYSLGEVDQTGNWSMARGGGKNLGRIKRSMMKNMIGP